MSNKFICRKCGLCCKNLDRNDIYKSLHNGKGVCKYLNLETNLCSIYENRPILCNIDLSYELYFSDKIILEEYYNLNNEGCRNLWEMNEISQKIR